MLHKHTACNRIDGLLMMLFDVLNVRADRDLVCRHDKTNVRKNAEVAHFLHSLGNCAMCASWETGLKPIIDFTCVVEEFNDHGCVLPIDVFLVNASHESLAELAACHGSIQETGWLLHFVL